MKLGQEALNEAKSINLPALQLDVQINFGKVLEEQDKEKAVTHLAEVTNLAESKGLKMHQAIAQNFLGDVYEDLGDF
jgi:hypothetical protein